MTHDEYIAKRDAEERARIEAAREHDRSRDRAHHEHNAEMNRIAQEAGDRRHATYLETLSRAVAAEERQAKALERIAEILEAGR